MIIRSDSPDGNAFAIMAYVRTVLKETGRMDEWPLTQRRMMSGDYANLCAVAKQVTNGVVEVIDPEWEEE